MKAKLKMTIIISVMCLVALCSIVAIIAIFAANTQTFNSNVSVSFKAPGVLGKVSANYYVGEQDTTGTPMTTTGTSSGEKELVFNDSPESVNGTLNPQGNIELTSTNRFVVFEYIFQNGLGNTVSTDYTAELSLNTSATNNIKMTTKQSKEKVTEFDRIIVEVDSTTGDNKGWMVVEHNEEDNLISTQYFYVKVEIDVLGKDASFSSNFNWELNLLKPTLDALTFTLKDKDHYAVAPAQSASKTPINLIIPKTYTGDDGIERPVTEITGFSDYSNDGYIYIPNSITFIDNAAFYCSNAIRGELIIPDSVEKIGESAFEYCKGLRSVKLGTHVTSINMSAFGNCDNLAEVIIDSKTVCEKLINSWENTGYLSTKTYLIDYATIIKAKYEITGIENFERKFTRNESQDNNGYWTYTYTE